MEEVMDSGECNEDLLITPNSIPSSKKNSKNQLDTKLINNEKDFLELQWVS
jgi:hypothetical protein